MILPAALVLGAQLVMAIADSVPDLNVEQVCDGIAKQGGVTFRDPAIAQEKKNCIDSEQVIRAEIAKQWSTFSPADKTSCVNESRMGGESSYTELLTCLEMARDVRTMRLEGEGKSKGKAAATPPPAPTPTPPGAVGSPTVIRPTK
jgi:hypothetical protein